MINYALWDKEDEIIDPERVAFGVDIIRFITCHRVPRDYSIAGVKVVI